MKIFYVVLKLSIFGLATFEKVIIGLKEREKLLHAWLLLISVRRGIKSLLSVNSYLG